MTDYGTIFFVIIFITNLSQFLLYFFFLLLRIFYTVKILYGIF